MKHRKQNEDDTKTGSDACSGLSVEGTHLHVRRRPVLRRREFKSASGTEKWKPIGDGKGRGPGGRARGRKYRSADQGGLPDCGLSGVSPVEEGAGPARRVTLGQLATGGTCRDKLT
jgi:hypothetical protein